MKVFLLKLAVLPKERHKDVVVGEWRYSDVFSSIEKAAAAGKHELTKRLKILKKLAYRDESIASIAEDEIAYDFEVYEFDTNVGRKRSPFQCDGVLWDEFVLWAYNHNGKLRCRMEWGDIGYVRIPGDEDEDAGTRFKQGDFVTITGTNGDFCEYDENINMIYALNKDISELSSIGIGDISWLVSSKRDEERVCVITGVPGKKSESENPDCWENIYKVSYIDGQYLYDHSHPHEAQIRPYEGEVPKGHPLWLFHKHAIGEIEISEDMWKEIFYRHVVFDYVGGTEKKRWRDMPELNGLLPESS